MEWQDMLYNTFLEKGYDVLELQKAQKKTTK